MALIQISVYPLGLIDNTQLIIQNLPESLCAIFNMDAPYPFNSFNQKTGRL